MSASRTASAATRSPRTDAATTSAPRRRRRGGGGSILLTIVVALGALVMVTPFLWLIVASTRTSSEIRSSPPPLVPGGNLFTNIAGLFESVGFGDALRNSAIVSITYTILGLAVCSLAGYAFAKFEFRGKRLMFGLLIASLALPGQVTLVPLFRMMVELGWLNSYQALILPNLAMPFGIFLMRQSMQAIPDELIHAARVDGAGEIRIFLQVVIPIMRPALAALAIFLFLAQWNDFVYPLIIQREPDAYTLPVALATLKGIGTTDYGQLMTGTLISILPVLVMFLFLQRYFVAGLLSGAVKQ